jgi:hypothetical protein
MFPVAQLQKLTFPFDTSGRMEVDFLCADSHVVVDLDGTQHLDDAGQLDSFLFVLVRSSTPDKVLEGLKGTESPEVNKPSRFSRHVSTLLTPFSYRL